MPNNNTFDDNILLKLHRAYGKDEAFKYLFEEIRQLKERISIRDFKIGEQKSEIAELQHQQTSAVKKKKIEPEWDKDLYIQDLKKDNSTLQAKNTQLTKDVTIWRNRFLSLQATNNSKDRI